MIDVNLKGTLYAVRGGAAAHARPARATWSRSPPRRAAAACRIEAVYCASKFGQVGFTRALDHELREHGIRCTNVCPGGVATDFALDDGRGRTPDVLPGMMTAEDVAEVVALRARAPAATCACSSWRSGR